MVFLTTSRLHLNKNITLMSVEWSIVRSFRHVDELKNKYEKIHRKAIRVYVIDCDDDSWRLANDLRYVLITTDVGGCRVWVHLKWNISARATAYRNVLAPYCVLYENPLS